MKEKTLTTMLVLALAIAAVAQTPSDSQNPVPNFEITPKGQRGWKVTKMTLAELGKRMDAAMKGLKNVGHQALVLYEEGATGKKGQMITTGRIMNSKIFSIEFPDFTAGTPFPAEVRADGKQIAVHTPAGWTVPTPLPAKPTVISPASAILAWPNSFPRLMYSNLIVRADIWTTLMKGFSTGSGGYKTFIEERSMKDSTGKVHFSYRVVAQRAANTAKKQNAVAMQIVIDGRRFLPVTLQANQTPLKAKKTTRMQWQGGWTTPTVKHPLDKFKLIKPSGPVKAKPKGKG